MIRCLPMADGNDRQTAVERWLAALEQRHLANLTPAEAARALRALSSCYVERRAKLAQGGALESAGKRAAFALFYAPLHFLVTREVVRALGIERVGSVLDLGCGTGAAGAAWSLECGSVPTSGVDRHPWAVTESNWTLATLGIPGRAVRGDVARTAIAGGRQRGVLLAYTVNELPADTRAELLPRLLAAYSSGAAVLVIEPIAKRMSNWWDEWAKAIASHGGRADEWRFNVPLPPRQQSLGRAAGLKPRELTARTLYLGGPRVIVAS